MTKYQERKRPLTTSCLTAIALILAAALGACADKASNAPQAPPENTTTAEPTPRPDPEDQSWRSVSRRHTCITQGDRVCESQSRMLVRRDGTYKIEFSGSGENPSVQEGKLEAAELDALNVVALSAAQQDLSGRAVCQPVSSIPEDPPSIEEIRLTHNDNGIHRIVRVDTQKGRICVLGDDAKAYALQSALFTLYKRYAIGTPSPQRGPVSDSF